jgi:hypothetical protein
MNLARLPAGSHGAGMRIAAASTMKIGLLTFHRCINYGSYWQARCLLQALRSRGHDAVLLDHRSRRIDLAEWRCALRPALPAPAFRSDRSLYASKARRFLDALAALPSSPGFDLDSPRGTDSYDLVIVGSDEVWNLNHPWYGRCPLFFGERVQARRLAAYGASFGNYPAGMGLPHAWAKRLSSFDLISVRDGNSREIVSGALGIEPDVVLDPCLQFPLGAEHREADHAEHGDAYVAVYGHSFSGWFANALRDWARRRDLKLVSIGYRNAWADDNWISAGPEEFRHFMAGARAIATNFFHGCVFALREWKPFVCERSPYRSIKIGELMALAGTSEHLVCEQSPWQTYEARLDPPLSIDIARRLEQGRRASEAYLDRVLSHDSPLAEEPRYAA